MGRELSEAMPFIYGIPLAGLVFGIYTMLHDVREWAGPLTRVADGAAAMGRRILGRGAPTAGTADTP